MGDTGWANLSGPKTEGVAGARKRRAALSLLEDACFDFVA